MRSFQFTRAESATDAITRHRGSASSAYIGGGTTLIDLVKLDVMKPSTIVDLNDLDLAKIETLGDGQMKIGALVRNSDLAWNSKIRDAYPVLAEAILCGASSQVRNMATTAGNLMQRTRCPYFRDGISPCNKREPGSGCAAHEGFNRSHAILGTSDACIATHPSDMCVALAALDADVIVQSDGRERRIPVVDFHLLPGKTPEKEQALEADELVTAVVLPVQPAGTRSWYLKLRDRESFEFALASAAVVLQLDGTKILEARIALGGVATKPWRAREAEELLRGEVATPEIFARAADMTLTQARPLKHNGFKVELARRVIVRTLSIAAAGQPAVREV
jgi:xanthine dehydrogenase YagS FAD-binding subunit